MGEVLRNRYMVLENSKIFEVYIDPNSCVDNLWWNYGNSTAYLDGLAYDAIHGEMLYSKPTGSTQSIYKFPFTYSYDIDVPTFYESELLTTVSDEVTSGTTVDNEYGDVYYVYIGNNVDPSYVQAINVLTSEKVNICNTTRGLLVVDDVAYDGANKRLTVSTAKNGDIKPSFFTLELNNTYLFNGNSSLCSVDVKCEGRINQCAGKSQLGYGVGYDELWGIPNNGVLYKISEEGVKQPNNPCWDRHPDAADMASGSNGCINPPR